MAQKNRRLISGGVLAGRWLHLSVEKPENHPPVFEMTKKDATVKERFRGLLTSGYHAF